MRPSNDRAIAALDAVIARIRSVGETPKAIAPVVAAELKAIIDRNIAAGQGPDGVSWPRKQDGGRALENAAAAVTVDAIGTRIVASVKSPEAFHHMGRTRGNVVRAILPAKRLPAPFILAIKRAVEAHVRAGETR